METSRHTLDSICESIVEQTEIDFRKYNSEFPNRTVPYELPSEVKQKILNLMKLADLNCASLDLILDEQLNHIFLEINPVGQFGMTSRPCNYYLEKVIANTLIQTT
ncbi:MAG: hypothetical protein IT237_02420 [Bacteroidia bacterium]|nr:hypothetical protein [Bacteroidia bacterium]